jgi:23S rRNA (guanosine2251-2'-O)-methyltransferase
MDIDLGDRASSPHPKIPLIIILDRLRSAHNVGNIFRLADAAHIEKVVTCGYTATPPHPKLEKTAMGSDKIVDFEHFADSLTAVTELKSRGYEIIAVETMANAELIHDATFTGKTALIVGNEALGIQEETLAACDRYIRLPAYGLKNSINVANCASVVLFQAAHQLR